MSEDGQQAKVCRRCKCMFYGFHNETLCPECANNQNDPFNFH
jgi:RNA polymerase subunit RPABC4/transcription elongation factor Spt4